MSEYGEYVTDRHLGGYFRGGDPDTFYPALWEWVINEFEIRSMIDVGCGDGAALNWFAQHGVAVLGVDGMPQPDPKIMEHDYTLGGFRVSPGMACPPPADVEWDPRSWDLAWSCEFVEHVEERFVPNFIQTFKTAKLVMMTHAVPGQGGHHHVNCQDDTYWAKVMDAAGFDLHHLTLIAREVSKANARPDNYFAKSGMVFARRP